MASREGELKRARDVITTLKSQIGRRRGRIHQGAMVGWEAANLALEKPGCGGCDFLEIDFGFKDGRKIVHLGCGARQSQDPVNLYEPFVYRLGERPECQWRSPFSIQG